ncbi:hypothetical protein BSKO_10277 [Bryopsis sp. KO-2023]|nr:hypothetical protein BSKO_10277 [Bryopsis sp. KO-2023]
MLARAFHSLSLPVRFSHVRRAQAFTSRALSSGDMQAVTYGNNIPGYEIGKKDAPAVIVLQEWWGINDLIKMHAAKISEVGGYRCLVPDLYKGKIGVDKEEAAHLMGNLDFKAATAELTQSVEYLKSTGSGKVGCVGFCMGGALVLCGPAFGGGLRGCVLWHSRKP